MASSEMLPAAVGSAPLPARYKAAKKALANCQREDECMEWADKALALASYARQAKDETLEKTAMRIRARAIRRAGELMRQIDGRPENNPSGTQSTGRDTLGLTRTEVAERAGISKRQRVQAVRLARVPEEKFEAAVESNNPPSVTKLADEGRRVLSDPKPEGFKAATKALGRLRDFSRFCESNDAESVARGVLEHEAENARRYVSIIDRWLDAFVVNIKEERG